MINFYPIHKDIVSLVFCVLSTLILSAFFWAGSFFTDIPNWLIIAGCLQIPLGFAIPSLYAAMVGSMFLYSLIFTNNGETGLVLAAWVLAFVSCWIGAYIAYSLDSLKQKFKAKK